MQRLKHSGHHFAVELILTKIEGLVKVLVYTWSVFVLRGVSFGHFIIVTLTASLPHRMSDLTATVTLSEFLVTGPELRI